MKKIFIFILILFFKLSVATCTLSVPSVNLGTYSYTGGNSVVENMTTTSCNQWSSASYDIGQTVSVYNATLSNGVSSITANATNAVSNISGTNHYFYPVCSNAASVVYGGVGVAVYCTTITVPSGKSLTSGTYTGSFPVAFYGADTNFSYTIPVSLTVTASCNVSSSGLSFGNVTGGIQTVMTGTVSSTCTNGATYTLSADGGNSANISARLMKKSDNSDSLDYQLYTDSGYSTVWGDGSTGSKISLTGTGSAQTTTIYGKIPAGRYNKPGDYSDAINVTLTY